MGCISWHIAARAPFSRLLFPLSSVHTPSVLGTCRVRARNMLRPCLQHVAHSGGIYGVKIRCGFTAFLLWNNVDIG